MRTTRRALLAGYEGAMCGVCEVLSPLALVSSLLLGHSTHLCNASNGLELAFSVAPDGPGCDGANALPRQGRQVCPVPRCDVLLGLVRDIHVDGGLGPSHFQKGVHSARSTE